MNSPSRPHRPSFVSPVRVRRHHGADAHRPRQRSSPATRSATTALPWFDSLCSRWRTRSLRPVATSIRPRRSASSPAGSSLQRRITYWIAHWPAACSADSSSGSSSNEGSRHHGHSRPTAGERTSGASRSRLRRPRRALSSRRCSSSSPATTTVGYLTGFGGLAAGLLAMIHLARFRSTTRR